MLGELSLLAAGAAALGLGVTILRKADYLDARDARRLQNSRPPAKVSGRVCVLLGLLGLAMGIIGLFKK